MSSARRSRPRLLREEGKRVHVFWLSGFIFFGSSNGLFERIKRVIEAQTREAGRLCGARLQRRPRPRHLGGAEPDQAAQLLRGARRDARLLGLEREHAGELREGGLFRQRRGRIKCSAAATRRSNGARTCCSCITRWATPRPIASRAGCNRNSAARSISRASRSYLERQELDNGEFLFRQGEPSDSVVLQASGCVAITIIDEHGRPIRLRRMLGHTVVGEMGFYRGVPRTASVIAEEPTVDLPADAARPSTRCRPRTRRRPRRSTS